MKRISYEYEYKPLSGQNLYNPHPCRCNELRAENKMLKEKIKQKYEKCKDKKRTVVDTRITETNAMCKAY